MATTTGSAQYAVDANSDGTYGSGEGFDFTNFQDVTVNDVTAPTFEGAVTGNQSGGDSLARDKIYVNYTEPSGLNASTVTTGDYQVNGEPGAVTGVKLASNGEDVILTVDSTLSADATPSVTQISAIEDTEGNSLDSFAQTTAADGLGPVISKYTVTNPTGQDVQVEFNSTEQLGAVSAAVSGAETGTLTGVGGDFTESGSGPYTYTATYSGASDGEYTITLNEANDTANDNNGATGQSDSATVDTTDPADLSIDKPTTTVVNTTDDTLNVNYSYNEANPNTATVILENGSNVVEYNIDDSQYAGDNNEKQVALDLNASSADVVEGNGFVDGTYNLTVNVTDVASNTTSATAQDRVVFDTTSPSIDLTSPTQLQYNRTGQDLTVEYDLTEANPARVNVTLADGTGNNTTFVTADTDGQDTITLTEANADTVNGDGLTNTTYNVTVTAVDEAGLSSSDTETDVLEIDDINPGDIQIEKPTSEVIKQSGDTLGVAYNYYEDNTESVTVTLNGSTDYTYNVDDSQYVNDDTRKSLDLDLDQSDNSPGTLNEGTYSVNVTVTDSAGNTHSAETNKKWVVINDNTADVNDASTTAGVVRPGDTITVEYNYTDQTNATSVTFELVDDKGTATTDDDEVLTTLGTSSDVVPTDDIQKELTIPDGYDGNSFSVEVSTENRFGETDSSETANFTINEELPSITEVETDAGTNTAYVHFNEDVYPSGDATFTVDDFAYQDVSAGGAIGIDAVTDAYLEDGHTVLVVDLNGDVQASDLEADLVNARAGQLIDSAGAQVGTETVAINDTTGPTVTISGLEDVTNTSADSYAGVSIDVDETVNVTVSATADSNINATYTKVGPGDDIQLTGSTLDLSSLEDTESLGITVDVEDLSKAGYTDSESSTVAKDTVKPEIVSATTNAGTNTITVELSEPVDGATFSGDNVTVHDVTREDADTYTVTTQSEVLADISTASLTMTGGTDDVGNAPVGEPVTLTDTEKPTLDLVTAETGDTTVELRFSESVYNDTDTNLTDGNIHYQNSESGVNHRIVGVEHDAGDTTATVTLNTSLVEDDIGNDEIQVARFNDSVDNNNTQTVTITDSVWVSDIQLTNTSNHEVQISFNATDKLDNFTANLVSPQLVEVDHTDETFHIEDATEEANGDKYTYTVNYTVQRDSIYGLNLQSIEALDGATDDDVGLDIDDTAEVDYEDPEADDAELTSDNKRNNAGSTVVVQFNEPIQEAGEFDVSNITFAGTPAENAYLTGYNEITVEFDTVIATGDAEHIEFGVDTVEEEFGDHTSAAGTDDPVDTHEYHLKDGVNFVSVPAEFGSLDIASSEFSDATVMTYENGEWLSYSPEKSADNQDIESLEGGQGYIVKTDADATVDITVRNEESGTTAESATPGEQQLHEGWNLVGHWQENAQDADTQAGGALATLDSVSTATHIYGQASDGQFGYKTVEGGHFKPGEAYWVFVENGEVYTVSKYDQVR
ncbi:beta strand repeat-containing protein [Halobellus inordinatus]|uniref:beta strand repeat-containing protein n=1 Tax=Halobellus inordinatus TaxID=1126236 RepID=UPI00210E9344|nr:hypothetical protein [Halobellus inordinatus]